MAEDTIVSAPSPKHNEEQPTTPRANQLMHQPAKQPTGHLMLCDVPCDIATFRLPRFSEIPRVGLYLEQVVRFVNEYLEMLDCGTITTSMVSNYVKRKVIPGPRKKMYDQTSIAYLMFVSFAKIVMTMDDIVLLQKLQRETYSTEVAYNYFCEEFENTLQVVFGVKQEFDAIGVTNTPEKEMLRQVLLSLVHKIYFETYLKNVRGGLSQERS